MKRIAYIHREDLSGFLRHLTDCRPDGRPLFPFFSAYAYRRQPLELRYPPVDQYHNGPLCRDGDHSRLDDPRGTIRDCKGRLFQLDGAGPKDSVFTRRTGAKIILEDIGTGRWMVLKNYAKDAPPKATKHWVPKGATLNYNPADYGLFLFKGAYNDLRKANGRIARHGQWRPFTMLDLRSLTLIRCRGVEYRVIEAPTIPQRPVKKVKERLTLAA